MIESRTPTEHQHPESAGISNRAQASHASASSNGSGQELEENGQNSVWVYRSTMASVASVIANVSLLISNATIFILTGSLALLATAADSFLDLVSQFIIVMAVRGNRNVDRERWPVGKSRLEPVGLIVVSSLMGAAAFFILLESIMKLAGGPERAGVVELHTFEIVLVGVAIGTKAILFSICWSLRRYSSTMVVLAEDHRNDVLSNIVALSAGLITTYVPAAWYADPIGAILISIYICVRWILVGKEQATMLIGKVANPGFLEKVNIICSNHSNGFMEVDSIQAYHFGHRFLVEIEVVVPPETSIISAHDSALSLQKKIEELEDVERTHVHVDYAHRDEDEHKKTYTEAVLRERRSPRAMQGRLGLRRRSQQFRNDAVEAA